MWVISTTAIPLYLLGITLASCKRAVIMLTFWRKSCFLTREVRFSDGILKFGKTPTSLPISLKVSSSVRKRVVLLMGSVQIRPRAFVWNAKKVDVIEFQVKK